MTDDLHDETLTQDETLVGDKRADFFWKALLCSQELDRTVSQVFVAVFFF